MSAGLTYIDLFAGAGGLSEGFYKAGYAPVAHVEMDAAACQTLRTRCAYYHLVATGQEAIYNSYLKGDMDNAALYAAVPADVLETVIQAEVSDSTIPGIFASIDTLRGDREIDVIIGGPPCQVYSLVGRSRIGAGNVSKDPRYELYKQYAAFLTKYKPKLFVFENVQGLLSAEGGALLQVIRHVLESCGYYISWQVLNSADYGVLQERKRVILIGRRGHFHFEYPGFEKWKGKDWTTGDALFADLPALRQGEAVAVGNYTTKRSNEYLSHTALRNGVPFVSQHITRPHNSRDLEIYGIAIHKWLDKRERLRYCDLPAALKTHKNETAIGDRYKVVNPFGKSHTVVAHLAKDGHYFIYPDADNPRSVSVREAARIQSFPDNFFFEGGRGNAFRQIGNGALPLSLAA